ncbi:hypothetical protein Q1W73_16655 [Asticcacaulis sp. ZE23SCel15]|uniref:hypothetical protein n=1 Tax=Asticcacaulis sp. ZE23SCel15 TaxID=3059027 RepID=UPI00265F0B88|nr:hypothetical protein [Asticcacaulis sp. ZE23SCel15]WKL57275.1 hypothetical protein Q1W73_16655 [Asticcacaulis sp. ZE23SCel15]
MTKERPILFNAPMVRALLDGHKTQTRSAVRPQPPEDWRLHGYGELNGYDKDGELSPDVIVGWGAINEDGDYGIKSPHGQPGDRLWVRETWRPVHSGDPSKGAQYYADVGRDQTIWKPSIHMPRWASRITLEITDIRVEALQDISEADAIAEGCKGINCPPDHNDDLSPQEEYRTLWETINGKGSWNANPWVWVVEFKVVTNGR